MSVSFCLPHHVAVSAFMICRGLCACTEMLWIGVLYVSFGSNVVLCCLLLDPDCSYSDELNDCVWNVGL